MLQHALLTRIYDKEGWPVKQKVEEKKILDFAYNLFLQYARNNPQGVYIDTIETAFLNAGIRIKSPVAIKEFHSYFYEYIDCRQDIANERIFRFVLLEKEQTSVEVPVFEKSEEEPVVEKKSKWRFLLISAIIMALFMIIGAVIFSMANDQFKEKEDNQALYEKVVRMSAGVPVVPEVVRRPGIMGQIDSLIEQELFSETIALIDDSNGKINTDSAKAIKKRLNYLISSRAKSLKKEILVLSAKGEHRQAFILEENYEKDIFQLAGNGVSKELRSTLITNWVSYYKNEEEGMSLVGARVRKILGNANCFISKNQKGQYYIDYKFKG